MACDPPIGLRRLSREDQYLDEGLWHVRERNGRWAAGDYDVALHGERDPRAGTSRRCSTPARMPLPSRAAGRRRRKPDARLRANPRSDFDQHGRAVPIITMWSTRRRLFWTVIQTMRRGGAEVSVTAGSDGEVSGRTKKSCCEKSRSGTTMCAELTSRPNMLWRDRQPASRGVAAMFKGGEFGEESSQESGRETRREETRREARRA